MDGSTRPAGELASIAGVGASAASEHLAVLVDAGLLRAHAHGRQRLYSIANQPTADALESLGRLCPTTPIISLRQSRDHRDVAYARLCYDHLAGRLGVGITEACVRLSWLEREHFEPTPSGVANLMSLGIDVEAVASGRRPLTRACPDWTERRPHLAGALGAAVADALLARRWVSRRRTGRGLTVTPDGLAGLRTTWGLDLAGCPQVLK